MVQDQWEQEKTLEKWRLVRQAINLNETTIYMLSLQQQQQKTNKQKKEEVTYAIVAEKTAK